MMLINIYVLFNNYRCLSRSREVQGEEKWARRGLNF